MEFLVVILSDTRRGRGTGILLRGLEAGSWKLDAAEGGASVAIVNSPGEHAPGVDLGVPGSVNSSKELVKSNFRIWWASVIFFIVDLPLENGLGNCGGGFRVGM